MTTAFWSFSWARPIPGSGTPSIYAIRAGTIVEDRLAESGAVRVGDTTGRAGWAYLRYRELRYTAAELDRIASEIRALVTAGTETFAFFRHGEAPDAAAAAAAVAARLRE